MTPASTITYEATAIERFVTSSRSEIDAPRKHADEIAIRAEKASRHLLGQQEELLPLVSHAYGFTQSEAKRALHCALELIRRDDLMRIWDREMGSRGADACPGLTVIFGGGVIPQPSVQAVVAAAMVSGKVLYRPASSDPVVAPRLIAAMEEMAQLQNDDPNRNVLCASWPHDQAELTSMIIGAADSLVIFGDQSAVDELTQYTRPECRRFIYGPKTSFAAIDLSGEISDGDLRNSARGLAEDVIAYNQRGCLSPSVLYLVGGSLEIRARVVNCLAEELDASLNKSGAPPIPDPVAYQINVLRMIYQMKDATQANVRTSGATGGWTLVYDAEDSHLRATPGYQTLFICPVEDWKHLAEAVADPRSPRVQAIGIGPSPVRIDLQIETNLKHSGLSCVCPLGQMQNPPLDWLHDDNPFFPFA